RRIMADGRCRSQRSGWGLRHKLRCGYIIPGFWEKPEELVNWWIGELYEQQSVLSRRRDISRNGVAASGAGNDAAGTCNAASTDNSSTTDTADARSEYAGLRGG